MEGERKDADIGYTTLRDPIYGELDGVPYIYTEYAGLVGGIDHRSKIQSDINILKEQMKEKDAKPICFAYYEGKPSFDKPSLFSGGGLMSLWEDEDGNLLLCSKYSNFFIEGKFSSSTNADYITYNISDGEETRPSSIELSRRAGSNTISILREWVNEIKKRNFKKADELYDKFFNPYIYYRTSRKEIWKNYTPKTHPLLYLTLKCFATYFAQPTVEDKHKESIGYFTLY